LNSYEATDVKLLHYHFGRCIQTVGIFTERLYAKNPKYEPDLSVRHKKVAAIIYKDRVWSNLEQLPSEKLLTAAFSAEPPDPDRVYLLGLGLAQGFREVYDVGEDTMMLTGLQVDLEKLKRLHKNISQVKWRLKVYRDKGGELLFLTNAVGRDGYINMGYEVLLTELLTRVEDDIYMRGGLPGKYIFDMSTMFMSVVL